MREKAEADRQQAANSRVGQLKNMYINRKGGDTETIVAGYLEKVVENEQNDVEVDEEEKKDEPEPETLHLEDLDGKEQIVERFYNGFLINSEGSAASDNVDITWLLKAVPTKVLPLNINQIRKFNFLILQNAIIA